MSLRFSALTQHLFRQSTNKVVPAPQTASRFRPGVEALEARDVPAVWTGEVSTDASDPANWLDWAPPSPWDPRAEFRGAVSSADCDGLGLPSSSIVMLDGDYTGTVTFASSAALGSLDVASGAVVVPGTLAASTANVHGDSVLSVGSGASFSWLAVYGSAAVTVTGATTTSVLFLSASGSVTLSGGGTVGNAQVEGGALALGAPVTAGAFNLSGGQVAQASGADLTVTGTPNWYWTDDFTWTGGTLNSAANLANVTITGSSTTALFQPAGGGTVYCGSNIKLQDGAVATLKEGTINVTNEGLEINIGENCGMMVDPGAGRQGKIDYSEGFAFGPELVIEVGAWFQVLSGNFTQKGPGYNDGGSLILENGTTATFLGTDAITGASFWQSAGATYIAASASVVVGTATTTGGMYMSGGLLSIKSGNRPAGFIGHVIGDLGVVGGDIRFESMASGDNHEFATFIVNGKVTWSGGTYHPYVSSESVTISDVWQVTGAFSISGTAAVAVTAVDGENNVVIPDSNMEWSLFTSDTSITAANNTPSLTNGYSFIKDQANPAKWWKVKKN